MRLSRAITVLAAGAATAWFLERRHMLPGQRPPEFPWPPEHRPQPPDRGPQTAEPSPQTAEPSPQTAEPSPQTAEPSPQTAEPSPQAAEPGPQTRDPGPEAPPAFSPSEQPTREQPAVEREEPQDVTAVVDDLIAPAAGREEAIVDAEVVDDDSPARELSGDERIAQAVREEIAGLPDIPSGAVNVEVIDGTVEISGEIDLPGTIREVDRRIRALEGVTRLRNLLHLPGTPPPS